MENGKTLETKVSPIHSDLLRFVKRERDLSKLGNPAEITDFETDLIMAGRSCAIRFGVEPSTDYYSMDDVVLMEPSPEGRIDGAVFNSGEHTSFGFEIQEGNVNEDIRIDFYLVLKGNKDTQLITFRDCIVNLNEEIILGDITTETL